MWTWTRAALFGLAAGGLLPSAAHAAEQLWTCGMHPQIIKKEPGNCPICGMKLTPIRANIAGGTPSGERKIKGYRSTMNPGEVSEKPGKDSMGMDMVPVYEGGDGSSSSVQIDAATIQRMNLKTEPVERGPVRREIRAVGTVAYNEQGLRDITTKYEGWIEKLHVNATWTTVQTGDPLFEIYSPDLYNAQINYLVARQSEGSDGGPLTRAALARLQLFDVSKDFIEEVVRGGEPKRTYLFRAPTAGVVIEKMAIEGQMMKPGERIYRLANLSSVWVLTQIYESDLPFVRQGQDVSVRTTYGTERTFAGKVDLLLPQVEEQTRTVAARLVLENTDGFLRPGMFVDVRFASQLADAAVLVPDVAVLRSGERNTVFVALEGGSFEPREVKLGARSEGNFYEVLNGLNQGERVVTSGQFMLDSESQLREAIAKMLRGEGGGAPAAPAVGGHEGHAAMTETPPTEASDPALLTPLAFATADAAAALATDDLAGYAEKLPPLRESLASHLKGDPHAAHGPLGKFSGGLATPADLEAARRAFIPFSTAVADLARAGHLHHTAGLHIFECSMAPGRWVQRTAELRNPFYGSAMSTCGTKIDAAPVPSAQATAAPSAHMPAAHAGAHASAAALQLQVARLLRDHLGRDISASAIVAADTGASMTDAEFLDYIHRSTTVRVGNGTCEGCGMTAAEMAAGAECAHTK